LRKAGFDNLFKAVITSDDIRNKKPHAEPLVMCGQKLGVPADRCVYVEIRGWTSGPEKLPA